MRRRRHQIGANAAYYSRFDHHIWYASCGAGASTFTPGLMSDRPPQLQPTGVPSGTKLSARYSPAALFGWLASSNPTAHVLREAETGDGCHRCCARTASGVIEMRCVATRFRVIGRRGLGSAARDAARSTRIYREMRGFLVAKHGVDRRVGRRRDQHRRMGSYPVPFRHSACLSRAASALPKSHRRRGGEPR